MGQTITDRAAYGDTTSNDHTTAHRPRKGRLARGPGQDRPAACPAGDGTPEQTGGRRDGGYHPPIHTGWSETSAARAIQIGMTPCPAEQCFPE